MDRLTLWHFLQNRIGGTGIDMRSKSRVHSAASLINQQKFRKLNLDYLMYFLLIVSFWIFRLFRNQSRMLLSSQSGTTMDQVLDKHLEKTVKSFYSKISSWIFFSFFFEEFSFLSFIPYFIVKKILPFIFPHSKANLDHLTSVLRQYSKTLSVVVTTSWWVV